MKQLLHILALLPFLLTWWGCDDEVPSRNHIPLLKQRLYQLQEAVKAGDRAAIDSLLSVKILSEKQSSDSLLALVYGPEGSYVFDRFALREIAYVHDKARIDCFALDSTGYKDRPIVLTYVYEHDLWLLKRFESGHVDSSEATFPDTLRTE